MSLTAQEKVRIRAHLGLHNVASAQTFHLGVPAATEFVFIVEGAMNKVLPEAEGLIRETLVVLDQILAYKIDGLELLQVEAIDEIKINQKNQRMLDQQYDFWRGKLCNALAVFPNPFDQAMGSSINVPVIG